MSNPVQWRGSQTSPIVFMGYAPSQDDENTQVLYSGTTGWFLNKLINEVGLPSPLLATVQPCYSVSIPMAILLPAVLQKLEVNKPAFIITCDTHLKKGEAAYSKVLEALIPETHGHLDKWAGSLLKSNLINWEHYVIPIHGPNYLYRNPLDKAVTQFIDLGRVKEEYEYWRTNKKLQGLPERELVIAPTFDDLYSILYGFKSATFLSNDIETIRRTKNKDKRIIGKFDKHPGYPYTMSLANSPKFGVSFSLWDYTNEQLARIWRLVNWLMWNIGTIGQNFFMFDSHFFEALGFRPNLTKLQDTRIRHHILWPELPHSLQFQTRQYTRQPYYKDEGKQWRPKDKSKLMRYNALDTTVTYEVFLEQEKEFAERPYLI